MKFIPVKETIEENKEFLIDPLCQESIYMTIDFYRKVGFNPPWICYYAEQNGELVGNAAFKGRPVNERVEIAYGTFEKHRNKGIATEICRQLVDISLQTDPSVKITARTLPEKNFSTKVLEKNNFMFTGIVNDPEDGEVWEWEYKSDLKQ